MLKIQAGQFIDVFSQQGYNASGDAELQVTVEGNFEVINMMTDIRTLMNRVDELYYEQDKEKRLRESNPALKDLYNKYKVVYELVKADDDDDRCNGGG